MVSPGSDDVSSVLMRGSGLMASLRSSQAPEDLEQGRSEQAMGKTGSGTSMLRTVVLVISACLIYGIMQGIHDNVTVHSHFKPAWMQVKIHGNDSL
jgi:hypothetical protein